MSVYPATRPAFARLASVSFGANESSAARASSERLLEVCPQDVRILEPHGEPEQIHRHAVALPAMSRLHRRLRAAERGCILDQTSRALDGLSVASAVEGDGPADSRTARRCASRVRGEPLGERAGSLGLALDPDAERLHPAQEQPGHIRGAD